MKRIDSLFPQTSTDSTPFDDNMLDAPLLADDLMILDQGQQEPFLTEELGLESKDSSSNPTDTSSKNPTAAAGDPNDSKNKQIVDKQAAEEDLEASRVGTPFYLAPELWKNPKYSPASDIWALGVILYELCCLSYPFPATEMDELEHKVLHDKIAKHPNNVS